MAILLNERVVAIHSMAGGIARIYGHGTATAEEEPQRGWLVGTGITAMRIELDNGGTLWSNECFTVIEANWDAELFEEIKEVSLETLEREPINAG